MRPLALAALLLGSLLAGCIGGAPANDAEVEGATAAFGGDLPPWHDASFDTTHTFSRALTRGTLGILPDEIVEIESDADGVAIQIGVARPDVEPGTKVPVIAIASVYFNDLRDQPLQEADAASIRRAQPDYDPKEHYGGSGHVSTSWLIDTFVPRGYAIALIPVRGSGGSGGCLDFLGPLERADLSQAVTWLGERPWSNGDVGMSGLSWSGSTPWSVMAEHNPHLRTIVPAAGIVDPHGAIFPHGYDTRGEALIVPTWGTLHGGPGVFASPRTHQVEDADDCVQYADIFASRSNAPAGAPDRDHPAYSTRDVRDAIRANDDVSVLAVQGFADVQVTGLSILPFVTDLMAERDNVHLLLHQNAHRLPDEATNALPMWDWTELLVHWFDRELRGSDDAWSPPTVQVQQQDGNVRWEDQWPPAGPNMTLYMTPNGALATEPTGTETAREAATTGHGDAPCTGCHIFHGTALDEPTHLTGRPSMDVTVTPHGEDGALLAKLYRQGPDDELVQISRGLGVLSVLTEEPIAPDTPVTVRLPFEDLDVLLDEGEHLVLAVSTTYGATWNEHEPDPVFGTVGAAGESTGPAAQEPMALHVGGNASALTLGLVDDPNDRTFTPPWLD